MTFFTGLGILVTALTLVMLLFSPGLRAFTVFVVLVLFNKLRGRPWDS